MGYDTPDWHQPATIAGGEVQVIGGTLRDRYAGATGNAWAALVPTAGRVVTCWTIRNSGDGRMDVGLGAQTDDMTLEPGESWSPPFNGTVYVRTAGGAGVATAYQAVAVEA